MSKRIVLLMITLLSAWSALGQRMDTIELFNPSFEDIPKHSSPPRGWIDCGFPGESPPDVHPTTTFNVLRPAQHGRTYLGMVTRENDTWESVQQGLTFPIKGGNCYSFSIYLCRSDTYLSYTKTKVDEKTKFTNPVKLRIWGSSGNCKKNELLAESDLVSNVEWKQFNFEFEPTGSYYAIILEAFYRTPVLFPYNGNLLLDNASSIIQIPCDGEELIASVDEDVVKEAPRPSSAIVNTATTPKAPQEDNVNISPLEETNTLNLQRDRLKKGSTFAIDNLYFEADSSVVPEACYPILDELYRFMEANSDIIIEIGGHTNSIPGDEYCNKLSLARAKSVAAYIQDKGIPERRLFYRGYGKTRPIADDSTPEGKQKNQRVEIRILYMKK